MCTRGVRTRASLSWILELIDRSPLLRLMGRDTAPECTNPREAAAGGVGLFLRLPARFRLDADLLEEVLARRIVRDQLGQQFGERHPPPADHLLEGVRNDRLRLRTVEELRHLQEGVEGILPGPDDVERL